MEQLTPTSMSGNARTDVCKQPPAETRQSVWLRRAVVASFWAVVAFVGFPVWWQTTAIYRADLPLQDMTAWANAQVCKPAFPLRIAVVDADAPLPPQEALRLLRTTQHALDALNTFSAHRLHLHLVDAPTPAPANASQYVTADGTADPHDGDSTTALSVRLVPVQTGSTPRSQLQPYAASLYVYYSPSQASDSSSTSSPLATYIAQELHQLYAEERAQLAHLLSDPSPNHKAPPESLSPELASQLHRRSTRAFRHAPTYHLTFSLFTPTSTPSAWDIEAALRRYMNPVLQAFSSVSNFTIDTQVQLYATLSPSVRQPAYDAETKAWTILREDLSGFVNAAEWPLSPNIGQGPTINFALYIPDQAQSPLYIQGTRDSSWLIPQWGGVMILNPHSNETTSTALTKEALMPAMQVFSAQLASLLGMPQTPDSLPVRISTLTRVQTAALVSSASSTLGALAQVYQKMPSIPVPDPVAESVSLSLTHLHRTCDALRQGRFQDALEYARIADGEAEKAFFERSMVGQVYFPDEHKVAVYLPLLGPVAVPLVMAALKELKSGLAAMKRK